MPPEGRGEAPFGTVVTLQEGRISETVLNGSALGNCPLDLAFYQDAATFFYDRGGAKSEDSRPS